MMERDPHDGAPYHGVGTLLERSEGRSACNKRMSPFRIGGSGPLPTRSLLMRENFGVCF